MAAPFSFCQVVDSHSHLPDENPNGILQPFLKRQYVMSVSQSDWAQVAAVCKHHPSLIPGFGIHPWAATPHISDLEWVPDLERALRADVSAIVGEIGLDFVAKCKETDQVEKDAQIQVFEACFDVAVKLQRPVSMHCVKAFGYLLELLKSRTELPPSIVLHSFGGSPEFANSLLSLPSSVSDRLFFGFSGTVNVRNASKASKVLNVVPSSRLLLESDVGVEHDMKQSLERIALLAASCYEMEVDHLLELTAANAIRAFEAPHPST